MRKSLLIAIPAFPALLVAVVASLEASGHVPLPMALVPLQNRLRFIFSAHMAAGSAALVLIFVVTASVRSPWMHRLLGRAALVAVSIAGVSAIPTALSSDAGVGAKAGFLVQGSLWLGFSAQGFAAARRGLYRDHHRAMVRMAAVAFGAVVLRAMLAASVLAKLGTEATYGPAAWLAWLVPLMAVVLAQRARIGERMQSAA